MRNENVKTNDTFIVDLPQRTNYARILKYEKTFIGRRSVGGCLVVYSVNKIQADHYGATLTYLITNMRI